MSEYDGADGDLERPARHERQIRESPLREYVEWPAVQSLLPPLEGARVLDVASGPGLTASRLAAEGAEVVGVDGDERNVAYAREEYGEEATFHHADLREPLSFAEDGSFDVVLSQLTLEFVADWAGPIEEFDRVLAPDGAVVASINHPFVEFLAARYDISPSLAEGGDGALFREATAGQSWYFDVELLGPEEPSRASDDDRYRRPLQAALAPFLDRGFAVTAYRELGPTEELRAVHEGLADRLRAEPPIYLCLRAEPR